MITVFAENGGLTLNGDNGQLANNIQTDKTLAYYIEKYNIMDEAIYFSSTMDFAEEEGFETNDGAKILFEEGVERYNRMKEAA
ncbi:MAG: hypothetical protein CBB97_22365 [Candidatus Endolissoclinum sp. TMED37]|nr:MAG: hypothetical protein CBB97_22365 [Candidatus Endolissoclinum sp. TMED37]